MPEFGVQRRSLGIENGETRFDTADPIGAHGVLLALWTSNSAMP